MITYLDNKNAQQYHILFDKATALLKKIKPTDVTNSLRDFNNQYGTDNNLTDEQLWDGFSISSLNEYFAYLEDICRAAKTDTTDSNNNYDINAERFYARLPLDEDVFAIDANSRVVTVPDNFAVNGVGVQGDELAEVVYFTINRFFDSTDLAKDSMQIAIQWELTRNGEVLRGFSRNFGKDTTSIPGTIIFGWPISHELTETSGSIRFAVRFYEVDNNNNSFKYSLTTLPATVRVNTSLDHDVISGTAIDHGNVITERIKRAGIYREDLPTPSLPIITTPIFVYDPGTDAKIIDLPANGDGVKIGIGAQPYDFGVIGYNWKHYPYDSTTGLYSSNGDDVSTNTEVKYVPTTEDLNPDYYYYTMSDITGSEVYSLINFATAGFVLQDNVYPYLYQHTEVVEEEEITTYNTIAEDGIAKGYMLESGEFFSGAVYKKLGLVTVNQTGIYTADITARALVNSKTSTMNPENGIKIPGPLTPVVVMPDSITTIENNQQIAHVILGNSVTTLTPTAKTGEADKIDELGAEVAASIVGANPNVDLTYKWEVYENNEWTDVTEVTDKVDIDGNDLKLEALVNDTTAIGDQYRFMVTSTRNGVSTTAHSDVYRVTEAPVKPAVQLKTYNLSTGGQSWITTDYTTSGIRTASTGNSISLGVNAEGLKTDLISYIWVQARRSDIENSANLYRPDLPEDDEEFDVSEFLIDQINEALGITDVLIPDSDPGDDTDTAVLRSKDDIIKALNNIAEASVDSTDGIADSTERYHNTYTFTEPGTYYCVVLNQLNNNIAVNVSPFFAVS